MATEQGVIIRTSGKKAIVKTQKTAHCAGCSDRASCTSKGEDMEVEVINHLEAKEGDCVVIEMETGFLLKAAFMMYVFPILCLMAGAILGDKLAPLYGADPSNAAVIVGFAFFGIAIWVMKTKGNQMGEKEGYKPRITRILPETKI